MTRKRHEGVSVVNQRMVLPVFGTRTRPLSSWCTPQKSVVGGETQRSDRCRGRVAGRKRCHRGRECRFYPTLWLFVMMNAQLYSSTRQQARRVKSQSRRAADGTIRWRIATARRKMAAMSDWCLPASMLVDQERRERRPLRKAQMVWSSRTVGTGGACSQTGASKQAKVGQQRHCSRSTKRYGTVIIRGRGTRVSARDGWGV